MLKIKYIFYVLILISTIFVLKSIELPSHYPIRHLVVISGLQLLTFLLLALQNQVIIQNQSVSFCFRKSLHMQFIGTFFDAITPMMKVGGEVVKMRYIEKTTQCTQSRCLSFLLIGKGLSLISLISLTFMFSYHMIEQVTLNGVGIGLMLMASVILLCLKSKKTRRLSVELKEQLVTLGCSRFVGLLILNSLIWLLFPLKLWILVSHYDLPIGYFELIGITLLSYFAGNLPVTPGGVGTFEAALVLALASFSRTHATAIEIAVLFRLVTYYGVFAFSGLYLTILEVIKWFKNTWRMPSLS